MVLVIKCLRDDKYNTAVSRLSSHHAIQYLILHNRILKYFQCTCHLLFECQSGRSRILSMSTSSGVSRISFRGGFKIFLEKWGNLHGAKRHAARGEATRLLGGFGGMLPRENLKKWCNLVRFREYFAKILSKKYLKK